MKSLYRRAAVIIGTCLSIGCAGAPRQELAPPVFELSALRLKAESQETETFRTPRFSVAPGHHIITAKFEAHGLHLSPARTLRSVARFKLRLFDEQGSELDQHAEFRKQRIDGSELGAAFEGIDSDEMLVSAGESEVHFVPRYYPFDSGWIPEQARSGELEINLSGPGELAIGSLEVRRSKWNFTLKERIEALPPLGPTPGPDGAGTAVRAANSQGDPATQLLFLQESLPHLPPDSINSICIEAGPGDVSTGVPSEDLAKLTALLSKRQETVSGFTFGVSYNPYWTKRDSWEAGRIEIGNSATIRGIEDALRPILARGAAYVLLRTDDLVPRNPELRASYFLDHPGDLRRFKTLGSAHGYLVRSVREFLRREFPDVKLYFVPPWYANVFIDDAPELAQAYFRDIASAFPSDAAMIWTGPAVRSLVIDKLATARFEAISRKAPAMLWDNTLYARKHSDFWLKKKDRVVFSSFIAPFDVAVFSGYAGPQRPFVFINGDFSPLGTIQYVTAGRYFAHPDSYSPERELWSYLCDRFGERGAAAVLGFDGALTEYLGARASGSVPAASEAKRNVERALESVRDALSDERQLLLQLTAITAAEFSEHTVP